MFRRIKKQNGFTLVEVAVTMIISGIIIWGLQWVLVFGIKEHNSALAKQLMLAEGSTKLRYIEFLVRQSESIEIQDREHPLRSRLVLRYPSDTGYPRVEIYADNNDGSLRIHDYRNGFNNSNRRILPMTQYSSNRRRRVDARYPYQLKELRFSFADTSVFDIYDNIPADSLDRVLKVTITLADSDSNEVTLSSYQSRFN